MVLIEYLKENLKGTFSWEKYCNSGKVDPKFGANQIDYYGQMPIVGVLIWIIFLSIICLFHAASFIWLNSCDIYNKIKKWKLNAKS